MLYKYFLMTPPKTWPLVHEDSEWMKIILSVLNDQNPARRGEMRRLVAAWDDVSRDVEKMLVRLPELDSYLYDQDGYPSRRVAFVPEGSGFRLVPDALASAGDGFYLIPRAYFPDVPPTTKEEQVIQARETFMRLLFNELRDSLAGPCRWKHCGKYFVLKGKRRTAYCTRPCCQRDAASRYTKERLQREHAEKLQRAEKAARRWRTTRRKDDWKTFVSKEPEITSKFLTRAVNKGELTTEGELTAKGKTFVKEHPAKKGK